MKRTPAEVGKIVMMRRRSLGLSQEGVPGVSDSLIRQIEDGTAPERGRGGKRQRFMEVLGWPPDALARLEAGADPESLVGPLPDPNGSELRDLLGVGGQIVQDELDEIKARLDKLEGKSPGDVVDLDTRRAAEGPGTGWARAAQTEDGTPVGAAPTIRPTKRPHPPDEGPDPTEFHD